MSRNRLNSCIKNNCKNWGKIKLKKYIKTNNKMNLFHR